MWTKLKANMDKPMQMTRGKYGFIMFSFAMVYFKFAMDMADKVIVP